mmetsp:Transcript_123464/g.356982  ORF Transcript_123464/g.356982 Transcript_123464/m.356982 type:complete len:238 (-) Transcript_123464:263-976(-)
MGAPSRGHAFDGTHAHAAIAFHGREHDAEGLLLPLAWPHCVQQPAAPVALRLPERSEKGVEFPLRRLATVLPLERCAQQVREHQAQERRLRHVRHLIDEEDRGGAVARGHARLVIGHVLLRRHSAAEVVLAAHQQQGDRALRPWRGLRQLHRATAIDHDSGGRRVAQATPHMRQHHLPATGAHKEAVRLLQDLAINNLLRKGVQIRRPGPLRPPRRVAVVLRPRLALHVDHELASPA